MRLRFVTAVVGLGLLFAGGCAKGLPTARRVSFGGADGLVAGPRPGGGPDGLMAGPRPGAGPDGLLAGPRPVAVAGGGLLGGPRVSQDLTPDPVTHAGPDRVTLLDGTPLLGELTEVTPTVMRFADGLTVPRIIAGGIEFGTDGELPGVGAHPLHDVVALRSGEWVEGAVVSITDDLVRLAVYGPDLHARGTQVIPRDDVAAIGLLDRRASACARAALVLADDPAPGRVVAEVSNLSIDDVYVFWLAGGDAVGAEQLLRCYERDGASGCQIAAWPGRGTVCGSAINGMVVHAAMDTVGWISEARRFYYALRDGERTLGASAAVQRDRRHAHKAKPARLDTEWRGEAHYWDTAWRDRKDDGIHAVGK